MVLRSCLGTELGGAAIVSGCAESVNAAIVLGYTGLGKYRDVSRAMSRVWRVLRPRGVWRLDGAPADWSGAPTMVVRGVGADERGKQREDPGVTRRRPVNLR